MANIQLLLEAERRGILPSDKQVLLDEARRRGLVSSSPEKVPTSGVTDVPNESVPVEADVWERGSVLPLARNRKTGEVAPAVPGLLMQMGSAAALPGDVYSGKTDLLQPNPITGEAEINSEVIQRGTDLSALISPIPPSAQSVTAARPIAAELADTLNKVPDTAELKQLSQATYKKANDAGLVVSPDSFKSMATNLSTEMKKEGFKDFRHPIASSELKLLESEVGPKTLDDLDALRQAVSDNLASPNAGERRMAKIMQRHIDDYMAGLSETDVIAGDATAAVQALKSAQDLWGRFRKSETIDKLVQRAGDRAGQFSGSGFENALRTEFRQLVMNEKKIRKFAPEEQAALRKISRGGLSANIARYVGKLAPRGIVSGVGGLVLGSVTGIGYAPVLLAGEAGRFTATKLTERNVRKASELVRSGARRRLTETISSDVLEHVQSRPQGRALVNDWLRAFWLRVGYGTSGSVNYFAKVTAELSEFIADELDVSPDLTSRINQELSGLADQNMGEPQNQPQ